MAWPEAARLVSWLVYGVCFRAIECYLFPHDSLLYAARSSCDLSPLGPSPPHIGDVRRYPLVSFVTWNIERFSTPQSVPCLSPLALARYSGRRSEPLMWLEGRSLEMGGNLRAPKQGKNDDDGSSSREKKSRKPSWRLNRIFMLVV